MKGNSKRKRKTKYAVIKVDLFEQKVFFFSNKTKALEFFVNCDCERLFIKYEKLKHSI